MGGGGGGEEEEEYSAVIMYRGLDPAVCSFEDGSFQIALEFR
jgi:hypothetical protein